MAFALNVNFQPSGTSVPAGYVADTGQTYANRGGNTFGWNIDNTTADRDRNATSDQRYDTLTHTQRYGNRTWELAVPNGQYTVRVVAGDPSYIDSSYKFNAEGVLTVNGTPTSGSRFVEGTKTVTVSDGRLTISNAAGASNNKLNFIEITGADGGPTLPSVSISATDSSASEVVGNAGTLKVTRTGSTSAAVTVNYAIGGSATNGTDYNTLTGSVVIPAGAASANIVVTPKVDAAVEGTESVTLTLAGSSAYTIGLAAASVDIADANTPSPDSNWPTSWATGATLTKPRQEGRGVAMDGKVWVFGGFFAGSSTGTQQVDYYTVATNTWTTLPNYGPMPHTHSAAVADPANKAIYLLGGLYGAFPGTPSNTVYRFDTVNHTWSQLPGMPENHEGGGAALVNGKLHYFGGSMDDRVTDTGRHIVLDLNNQAAGWQAAPSLPNPRAHFSTVVLDGKIYAIGGQYKHDQHVDQLALVHRYDPVNKTWEQLADLPTPKSHAESSTIILNGKIIVAGGQIGRFNSTDEVVSYDPSSNKWSGIGKLPIPLQSAFAMLVGDKIVVTTGNRGDNTPRGDTYIGELLG